ncbi:MAG: FAD-dependent oxidoreductase [Verrucomicrobia bacterium]|nr:FAD-dependent oxidoreductase [Verrucomicrobiota bacterium]
MKRRDALKIMATGVAGVLAGRRVNAEPETPGEVAWSRKVPVRYEADVAVLGGGIAGVSAACAAARSGAKVLLVERFAITGGDLTSGGVASFCGETAGQGEVLDEILTDMEKFKTIEPYKPYPQADHRVFDHHILAIVLQEILLRRKVKLLLHTRFVDVRLVGGRITECIVCGKSGPEALRAKQFIDCTGDADVARMAGFAVMKGQPHSLPMSMMSFVRHVEKQEPQLPDGWFEPVKTKEALPMTSIWPNGPGSNALKIKIPMFDATDTESLTAAEIRARRRTLEVLDYYQRVLKKGWRYDGCSPQIGIREGARITGDYVLTLKDLRAGRVFDDGVARGVYYLDGHKPDDDKRTYILKKSELKVPPYQIPLRSLIAKDGVNLLMAGRCFSAEQLALSSARVSTSCAMMGQAAGIASAMATQKQTDPRKLDPQLVRRVVEERGGKLS